jgi:hypothetical protein
MYETIAPWLKGLLAAVIGGLSNAIVLMVVDPSSMTNSEWPKLATVAAWSALLSVALYLKQSPLP